MVQHAAESTFSDNVWNVLIGIAGSLISLWLLFCIKPSLRLTLERGLPGHHWWKRNVPLKLVGNATAGKTKEWMWCSSKGLVPEEPREQGECKKCGQKVYHYRLEIENLGLAKVVEVECRLKVIMKNLTLGTRESVPSEPEEPGQPNKPEESEKPENLLELSGKWYEARRDELEFKKHTGDRYFHWVLPCGVSPGDLKDDDYYLLQVWSRHGFTNFGRVHKLRLLPGGELDGFIVEDPDTRRRRRPFFAWMASFIANRFKRKHPLEDGGTTPPGASGTSPDTSGTSPDTSETSPDTGGDPASGDTSGS
jgi:hypothetical protein